MRVDIDLQTAKVDATEIHRILAEIYIAELGRPKDNPLDANAVATWGSALFTYGPRDDVIESLRKQIAASKESREFKATKTQNKAINQSGGSVVL
ncbi:hypothetical protein F1728_25485 [Gimesia benthica]|uniref:Uncharacterized protein n=1 Tax=Gimesia benthica TaxID=2608982 RepID=A0A6I6AMZ0_9PLAN|nr:hypothetical protein [Gimesia benthica]QGQ25819.1 hypothetical protein F1728_25485 [Gimesia benthica]